MTRNSQHGFTVSKDGVTETKTIKEKVRTWLLARSATPTPLPELVVIRRIVGWSTPDMEQEIKTQERVKRVMPPHKPLP
jgi:hypothetical protein